MTSLSDLYFGIIISSNKPIQGHGLQSKPSLHAPVLGAHSFRLFFLWIALNREKHRSLSEDVIGCDRTFTAL